MDDVGAPTSTDALRASLERALGAQYRFVRLLGRGGMGAVFLAREESLERLVAIKVLPPGREGDGDSRERLRREAKTAARLAHPNIVPLHGFGEVDGMLYLAMGYVNGESLATRLKRDLKLPADETRRILADVAEALDYAHRRGVIHRDVKPDNILIDDETGRALLADFGIAKAAEGDASMTRAGFIVGTPLYMSPEQARGEELDGRSDLYSLGAVGYALLSGRAPFEGATPQEAIVKRLTQDAPPLEAAAHLPADVAEAVNRCLARDRGRRFPDARAFRQAIAPSALDDDELPEPLDALDGKAVSIAAALVALGFSVLTVAGNVLERDYWLARQVYVTAQPFFGGLPAFPVITGLALLSLLVMQGPLLSSAARAARRRGFSLSQIVGAFFRQPRWWRCFWYPRRFRRRDDVWDRLPDPFRRWRVFVSIVAVDLVLFFAWMSTIGALKFVDPVTAKRLAGLGMATLIMHGSALIFIIFAVAAAAAPLTLLRCARLMRSHGFETYELRRVSRAFMTGPTGERALWRKPELARLLLPPRAAAAGLKPPASPREYPDAIARLVADLRGDARRAAERAVAAARSLASVVAAAEEQLARLLRDVDAKEMERLERRLSDLGPEDAAEDDERREMRQLLSKQRDLLRRYESRAEECRARRERALRVLQQLWRAAHTAGEPGRDQGLAAALTEAESFDAASAPESVTTEAVTRARPAGG